MQIAPGKTLHSRIFIRGGCCPGDYVIETFLKICREKEICRELLMYSCP